MSESSVFLSGHVVVLSGGVGGARMARGLARALGNPARLTVAVNTADDFVHLGFAVSPDLDTVLYTLAGIENPVEGWGRADETWSFMATLDRLGGETWFQLGDKDLALHVFRTQALAQGRTLSAVTAELCRRFDISVEILPMTDDRVTTVVETEEGPLAFQDYFVRRRCQPKIKGFRFIGSDDARPSARLIERLKDTALGAVVLGPSNPFVSIAPILAVPGVRAALEACPAPIVAVSPLVGGAAVKGPAAKMIAELGQTPSVGWVAEHYAGLIDGIVVDEADRAAAGAIRGPRVRVAKTVMRSDADRATLAAEVLGFALEIGS
ncbi:MAG: 2-phospho-L-lactate transferase [Rhodospirillales bacterium]|nr:2-phospho-L-lactate transferase [Rhodospirillales bacterium]MSP79542.1 2-phospho-L-lactate transferase [Rhodospirillales bacterium]